MALLTSSCQGALRAGWDGDPFAITFNGLRPVART